MIICLLFLTWISREFIGPSDPQLPVYLDADPGDVPLIPRWSRQGTQTSQTHTTYFAWILEKVYVTTSHLALV